MHEMRSGLLFVCWLLMGSLVYGQQKQQTAQPTLFALTAVDDASSAFISAKFTVDAQLARKKFTGASLGTKPFTFSLRQADTLTVVAEAPGYYISEELMAVSCDTCADYAYVVRLAKREEKPDSVFRDLRVNQTFQLDKVYFDQSSYVLRTESYPQLDKLVKTLRTTPKLIIEIAGHTDNVGDRRLNQALSHNRAKIIQSYLMRNGITESRLRFVGYGDSRPAAPNDSEENKRKNRRVEFVVVSI
jgi:outer membrane protein OmpA-like peptidoglycan-associated protein